jgi:hypothetical protein
MFWCKRSPEEEKSKLVKQKKSPGNVIRGRKLPRGNRSLFLRKGHADLLPLMCRLRLGLNPALPADTYAGRGRSLIQRSSVNDFLVRDSCEDGIVIRLKRIYNF